MTEAQKETVEMLSSLIDNLNVEPLKDQALGLDDDTALVFEGDDADGPRCGYINLDGTVEWLV